MTDPPKNILELEPLRPPPPAARRRRAAVFWTVFVCAYFFGAIVVSSVDDAIHWHVTGHHGDGSIFILTLMAAPVFAGVSGVTKTFWVRADTIVFAGVFPVAGPLVAYLLWVLVAL